MTQPFSSRAETQLGVFYIILALGLFGLIAIIGLSVDATNIYVARASLQKSIDAAAIKAGNMLNVDDPAPFTAGEIRQVALDTLQANLKSAELLDNLVLPLQPPQVYVSQIAEDENYVRIAASLDVPTIFITYVPWMPDLSRVSAQTGVTYTPTRVAVCIVLDVTASMGPPWPFVGVGAKMLGLRAAAIEFVSRLRPNKDELCVITYARPTFPINSGIDPHAPFLIDDINVIKTMGTFSQTEKDNLIATLNGLVHVNGGSTAMYSGIYTGQQQMAFVTNAVPIHRRFVVLFTDGYANRSFQDPLTGSSDTAPPPDPNACDPADAASIAETNPSASPHTCTLATGAAVKHYWGVLNIANQLRSAGIGVYTVGLGDEEPVSDHWGCRDPFLSRLANDNWNFMDPSGDWYQDPLGEDVLSTPCDEDYDTYNDPTQLDPGEAVPHEGKYFLAVDPTDLIEAFRAIADLLLEGVPYMNY